MASSLATYYVRFTAWQERPPVSVLLRPVQPEGALRDWWEPERPRLDREQSVPEKSPA